MTETDEIIAAMRAAIAGDPGINQHETPITIEVQDGELMLGGEVPDIGAKRRILRKASRILGVTSIVDHLGVAPAEHRGDGEILDAVYNALTDESVFKDYSIASGDGNDDVHSRRRDGANGTIRITVTQGEVTLGGDVQSLSHRRFAEVLAWWAPGTVNVHDDLRVVPPEQDTDDEITDAIRIVLEKDPWLDASQISVRTHAGEVVLDGMLHSSEQRHMAECNAWYIAGVGDVRNRIEVRP
jgi:osmotically-inducible protein OsmY